MTMKIKHTYNPPLNPSPEGNKDSDSGTYRIRYSQTSTFYFIVFFYFLIEEVISYFLSYFVFIISVKNYLREAPIIELHLGSHNKQYRV